MLFKRLGINAIARVIRNAEISKANKQILTRELVKLFAEDNPLFDEARFRQLCSGKLTSDMPYASNTS